MAQRFPPLTVPTGFMATLFACDPLIEYPSVIPVKKLTFRFQGRDYRLTDVHGKVVKGVLA